MGAKTSKKRVSSYQRLKAKKDILEMTLEAIIERPHSSEAKSLRTQYKIDKGLI